MTDEKKDQRVRIRANAMGFGGEAVSIFAMYDPDSGVLAIAREAPYETVDRPGFLRLTTRESDPFHDSVFTEDDVRDGIVAFFDLEAGSLVQFADGLTRLNPKHKIESEGLDERGVKYRLAPDVRNGHVALLMISLWSVRQRQMASASSFMANMLMTI